MTEEIKWVSLKNLGFSNFEISDHGRVKNVENNYKLAEVKTEAGYVRSHMKNDSGIYKKVLNHVLVAKMFIGIPDDNTLTVDHINRIRNDNRVENLRWATKSQQSSNQKDRKPRGRSVYQMDKEGKIIKKWDKIVDVSRELKISDGSICNVCKGKRKSAGGFTWGYCDDVDINDDEIWKEVPYPEIKGMLMASNLGRIKFNKDDRKTEGSKHNGYLKIGITTIEKVIKNYYVHRLVIAAFNGINNDKIVNHKDGNKYNNKIENLEYCTQQENTRHAVDSKLLDPMKRRLRKFAVIQYDMSDDKIAEFESIKEASEITGVRRQSISAACKNKIEHAGYYIWKYKRDVI